MTNHTNCSPDVPTNPFARWAGHVEETRQRDVDVIRLDIGSPDMPPPEEVIDTLCQSARKPDCHGYPDFRGLPVLREAIARYYESRFGVTLDPDTQVLPLIGSKEGIVSVALAFLGPGDLALVPDPGYPLYSIGATLAGAEVHSFHLSAECGYLPNLETIPRYAAERAVLMWLNYPNNPTGATADLEALSQAVDYARSHGLLLCHDAAYCDVTYGSYVAPSLLQVPGASEVAVEFSSLSKTYNMAGWRVGAAVGKAHVLASLLRVKSNMNAGIFRPVQEAAIQALSTEPEWLSARNEAYRERLEIIQEALDLVGMEASRPRATPYVWAGIPKPNLAPDYRPTEGLVSPGWTSEAFALALLQRTGVAVAPGSFFGPGGEGRVRLSVTAATTRIVDAMERIRRFAAPSMSALA